jgi:hypothetical protein
MTISCSPHRHAGGTEEAVFHPPTRPRRDAVFTKRPQRCTCLLSHSFSLFSGRPFSRKRANPTFGTPRRVLFRSEHPLFEMVPSKLAHTLFGRGLIDLPVRAWTSTDFLTIRLIWCARSASKGDQQPSRPSHFWCAAFREHKRPTGRSALLPHRAGCEDGSGPFGDRTRVRHFRSLMARWTSRPASRLLMVSRRS